MKECCSVFISKRASTHYDIEDPSTYGSACVQVWVCRLSVCAHTFTHKHLMHILYESLFSYDCKMIHDNLLLFSWENQYFSPWINSSFKNETVDVLHSFKLCGNIFNYNDSSVKTQWQPYSIIWSSVVCPHVFWQEKENLSHVAISVLSLWCEV